MANHFCANPPSLCFDPSDPTLPGPSSLFQRYSSEAPDVDLFFGRNYRPFPDFPPLGSNWYAMGCVGWCISAVSQEDANNCAQRQAASCLAGEWPINVPNTNPNVPPDSPPDILIPRTLFPNLSQSASFTCPDGSLFTFVVPFGTFLALTQTAANLMAESYALQQATVNRLCFGELIKNGIPNDGLCVGEEQAITVSVSSGHTPLTFTILSGAVPSGMVTQQNTNQFIISGIPSTVGTYTFVLQAQDSQGHLMQKSYTIYVEGIANTSLPAATVGTPYSDTLLPAGPTLGQVTWQVLVGSLPSGLTLNINTGVISGTPTTQGSSNITVLMTDNRVDCQKQFTISVSEMVGCPNWSGTAWTPSDGGVCFGGGICTPFYTATGSGAGASISSSITDLACCGTGLGGWTWNSFVDGTLTYNGPGCHCRLVMTLGGSPGSSGAQVFVDGLEVLHGISSVAGEHIFTFDIADTLGADVLIEIFSSVNITLASAGTNGSASMTCVFQNI